MSTKQLFLTNIRCQMMFGNNVWPENIQQAGLTNQQKFFYNGCKHGHFTSSVFCFCPDGTIPIAMNLPGSMHDSMIADLGGMIYNKLCQQEVFVPLILHFE